MKRRYDIKKVIKIVKEIKKNSPNTLIYSHFIIGYPGESWVDFFKTMICCLHFDLPIVISYSEHEGADSVALPNHKSRSTIILRDNISNFFLNFVVLYKFLRFKDEESN